MQKIDRRKADWTQGHQRIGDSSVRGTDRRRPGIPANR